MPEPTASLTQTSTALAPSGVLMLASRALLATGSRPARIAACKFGQMEQRSDALLLYQLSARPRHHAQDGKPQKISPPSWRK
jgi:hypothetical protein